MLLVGRPEVDPLFDRVDLRVAQRLVRLAGRHAIALVFRLDPLEYLLEIDLAGDVEPHTRLSALLVRSVAGVAVVREDGPHSLANPGGVGDRTRSAGRDRGDQRNRECGGLASREEHFCRRR